MSRLNASSRIVTFRLGADLFAADILSVERVLRHDVPRSIPNLPDWIDGVVDYNGRLLPVVDLRRRLDLPRVAVSSDTRMLVFNAKGEWVAVVVDQVLDVRPIAAGDISDAPTFFRGLAADYVRGLVRRGAGLVLVLDIDHLLASHERLTLDPLAS